MKTKNIFLLIIIITSFIPITIFSQENTTNFIEDINVIQDTCNFSSSIYDRPYSLLEHYPQKNLARINTGIFIGGAVAAMGVLYLLPESITKWDKKTFTIKNIFNKWKHNVTTGPVIDNDNWFMNYVGHPYWGAIYYMDARSLGYNAIHSAIHSAIISTFLWEYGFEALAEVPAVQDLIVTPIAGSIIGELFYLAKREIVNNDYKVLNSKILGHFITFLIDPTNEIVNLFMDNNNNNNIININVSLIIKK